MISVAFNNGTALIYNVDDWFELRTKHRIIGEFFGITKTLSISLPLALSPEETYMLIKKQIITLQTWPKLHTPASASDKRKFNQEMNLFHEEQTVLLREERRLQLEGYIDKIIERKKESGNIVSRNETIEEEMKKLSPLDPENIITPIYMQHPTYLKGTATPVSISEVLNYTSKIKCAVYEDLWEKGYFITVGTKFGGDFLVYLGDPISFHAVYIIKCVEDVEKSQNVTEIVMYGRLGNSVKKKFVLASVKNEKVVYITLSWMDSEIN